MTEERVKQRVVGWKIVFAILLAAFYARGVEFVGVPLNEMDLPVTEHPVLPPFFLSPKVALATYLIPLAGWLILIVRRLFWIRLASVVMLVCCLILSLHLTYCTDASFVASSWVALWLVWWSFRLDSEESGLDTRAALFGKAVVALCFFGGGVGKLTGAYWDGEAIYQMYFKEPHNWSFDYLRGALDAETYRAAATWVSRAIVGAELVLATVVFWPTRWALVGGAGAVIGMTAFFTPKVFSAVGPLLALLVGCYYLSRAVRE